MASWSESSSSAASASNQSVPTQPYTLEEVRDILDFCWHKYRRDTEH